MLKVDFLKKQYYCCLGALTFVKILSSHQAVFSVQGHCFKIAFLTLKNHVYIPEIHMEVYVG